jgi:hypothetical protein
MSFLVKPRTFPVVVSTRDLESEAMMRSLDFVAGVVVSEIGLATRGDALALPISNAAPLIKERRLVERSIGEDLVLGEELSCSTVAAPDRGIEEIIQNKYQAARAIGFQNSNRG